MAESADGSTREPSRRPGWTLLLLGVFLVGLLAGGLIVAVFSDGGTGAVGSTPPTTRQRTPAGPPTTGPGADVLVSPACLRAVNEAQQVYAALRGAADAARRLDAGALDRIVRQLQPLQQHLQRDLPSCRATVRLPSAPATSGHP